MRRETWGGLSSPRPSPPPQHNTRPQMNNRNQRLHQQPEAPQDTRLLPQEGGPSTDTYAHVLTGTFPDAVQTKAGAIFRDKKHLGTQRDATATRATSGNNMGAHLGGDGGGPLVPAAPLQLNRGASSSFSSALRGPGSPHAPVQPNCKLRFSVKQNHPDEDVRPSDVPRRERGGAGWTFSHPVSGLVQT